MIIQDDLKKLFIDILLRESALSEIIHEQNDIIHEFTISQLYATTGSYMRIADYLGVPDYEKFEPDEDECFSGECRHGAKFYCRDWITDAMCTRAKEFPGDSEEARFEAFLNELINEGERCKGVNFGPCLKCE